MAKRCSRSHTAGSGGDATTAISSRAATRMQGTRSSTRAKERHVQTPSALTTPQSGRELAPHRTMLAMADFSSKGDSCCPQWSCPSWLYPSRTSRTTSCPPCGELRHLETHPNHHVRIVTSFPGTFPCNLRGVMQQSDPSFNQETVTVCASSSFFLSLCLPFVVLSLLSGIFLEGTSLDVLLLSAPAHMMILSFCEHSIGTGSRLPYTQSFGVVAHRIFTKTCCYFFFRSGL